MSRDRVKRIRGQPVAVPEVPAPGELCPALAVAQTDQWYVCGEPWLVAGQGWKLYVSLTILNARAATTRLVPLLAAWRMPFKYIRSIEALRMLNAGEYGYSQIGKCFVIYAQQPDDEFIGALKDVLAPYRDACPAVPCALPFGDGLPLYYRYGAYAGRSIELPPGTAADDRRALSNAVPQGVQDVLARHAAPPASDPFVAAFLRRYPVFRALVQQGKCGVFHGMDLNSPTLREVALKVGYHRGQVQLDGSDGCSFLRHELRCYRQLETRAVRGLAPALIDALDIPRKVILVLEYVPGPSLLAHKLAGALTVEQLERAWTLIEQFHAHGMFIGDAKLANVLVTGDGDLRMVDFESAGVIGDDPLPFRTFFVEPEPDDPCLGDKVHFLASVVYPYRSGRYDWQDRQSTLSALLTREAEDDASAWALERLRALEPRIVGASH